MAKKNSDATPAPRRRTSAPRRATASDPSPGSGATVGATGPTYDEIAQAAYLRYLSRGGSDGQDLDDWVAAERELKGRHNGVGT